MYNIEIKNVTKRYDDKLAVDNISLDIKEGEIFGLLGPNGAGKSTLISMLCGLLSIDKGDILVGGHSIIKDPLKVKNYIGYVPQDIALFENLSIIDNLNYFGRMYNLKGSVLKEKVNKALTLTSLMDRKKDKVKKLSGGMKRRLNIACAILHDPKIIIMDEPTVGIDPQSRNHILEFTKNLNREHNATIIYTSHYMEEVESLCDNIMILDLGKELVNGTKENILRTFSHNITIEIFTSHADSKIMLPLKAVQGVTDVKICNDKISIAVNNSQYKMEDIIRVLTSNNCSIKNISIISPNLESVFLSLTGKNLRE